MRIEAFPVRILIDGTIVTDYSRILLPIEDKIRYRRDKVTKLLSEGCTQLEISNKIHCSLSTIEKDIKALREGAWK